MEYTNELNIPENLTNIISKSDYHIDKKHTLSATEILKPVRIHLLEKIYKGHLKQDISSMFFAWLGSGIHKIFENHYWDNEDVLNEVRMYMNVGDDILTGQFDMFVKSTGTLIDVKSVGMYAIRHSTNNESWEKQLNIYAYMMKHYTDLDNNIEDLRIYDVKELKVLTICRDWTKSKAVDKKGNVIRPIDFVTIPLWSEDRQRDFINSKLDNLKAIKAKANGLSYDKVQDVLPLCSPTEHWSYKRCANYCSISQFCKQYQAHKSGVV